MGIHQITYKIAQESGVETQDNRRFDQTGRLTFQATSNSPATDNTYTMRNDPAAPLAGVRHPFIPTLFANRVNCRKVSGVLYEFDVDYRGRGKPGESPLDEPPTIEFDFAVSEEPYDTDYEGTPICFVTGESPDPPLRETVYDLVIRIARNLKYVDPDIMSLYAGRTNSDIFFSLPPGTCKITEPPKARSRHWEQLIYYECTIGITVRRGEPGLYEDAEAWYRRVLAAGYYIRAFTGVGNKTKIVHATDSTGARVTKPILHSTIEGFPIPRDPDTGLQDLQQADWYKFKPRKAPMPFAALNIL